MSEINNEETHVPGIHHPLLSLFPILSILFFLSTIFCFVGGVRWGLDEEGLRVPLIPNSQEVRRRRDAHSDEFDAGDFIPPKYNINFLPPTVNGTPTHVQMGILVRNVRDIKDISEELTLEVNMKIYWKDERLRHLADWAKDHAEPFIVLQPETIQKLWHPDIYIDHIKTITQASILSKPASLRVYQDGTLRYSARLTLAQSCQMDFHYYPADTQRCSIDLMSYAYNDAKLNLTWEDGRGALLANQLILPNFDVGLANPETFLIVSSSGRYAGLRFTVLIRRRLSYHLLQTYLPSTLFIFVSWQSFLVPLESVPARIALCMTQNIPNVSYIKAIDVWMVSCIIFVFLTLLEYTTLLKLKSIGGNTTKRKHKKHKAAVKLFSSNRTRNDAINGSSSIPSSNSPYKSHFLTNHPENNNKIPVFNTSPSAAISSKKDWNMPRSPPESMNEKEDLILRIERLFSVVIPSLFIVFNFVYWPWLLHKAKYYH